MDYILGGNARREGSAGVLRKKAENEATRLGGMSITERGRARDSEREWGEGDMVESFREYSKAMNACT